MAVFSCLLASSEFLPARPIVRFLPFFGKGEADVDLYDTLVVDRLLMVVVERNGLGVIEHVLAVVVLLGGDGVIDDLEVATLAFDFVGDGFDVVPDAPHREMIFVSSPFVAPERVVGWVVPGTAVAAASRKVLGLQLYGFSPVRTRRGR